MKIFLTFLALVVFTLNVSAQFTISGKISDNENKFLSAVTIKLSSKNGIKYAQSNETGYYSFNNLKADEYKLAFSSINFLSEEKTIILKENLELNVVLTAATTNLNDVQVSFKKPLVEKKIDRTVFNAENSIAGIGTDALELLGKVPGVRVLNDKISLVGKSSVNVMINDKLVQLSQDDLSNYLKSIPSASISKIEVITNPPAKYDAQGNNGLINIVLKKVVAEGFQGAINSVFTQASHETASIGGNLNYRKNNFTLYGNFNFRKGSLVPFEQSDIFYADQTRNTVNKDRNFRTVPSGQVGMDYQLSKNTVLGVSYNAGHTDFHSEENIKTTILNQQQKIDSILNSDANAIIKSNYNAANFYIKQLIDSAGKQIIFNADWFKYNDDKQRFFNNTGYYGNGTFIPNSFAEYLSASKQKIDLYTLKADVDLPYKIFKLSVGAKLSFIKNASDVSFYKKNNEIYQLDPNQSNVFNYEENTQAIYVNVNKQINKWAFQAGLRGEYTQVKGISVNEENQTDYFQLFPTLFISYDLNNKSVLSINYGRRINRPAYRKLNPFRWYSNPSSYAEGNPFLQPSYNNNIEISHTYAGIFTTVLSFSNTSNGYSDVNFVEASSNIQVSKPVNFITGNQYQLSNSITLNQLKWLESSNRLDILYSTTTSKISQTLPNLNGFGAYFSTLNQFTLNQKKTLFTDISFWYQFPGLDGFNKTKSQSNIDLGFKTLLLNKKLQLAFSASDVFKTNKDRFNTVVNGINQSYNNYYDSRQFRLSIRYSFGNAKIKQQDRKPGNEEERRRSN
ncbi:outer membrane beta-barrel family protein [Pedobacter nototheniae]|uniref:outer membrane beta-barrel family protein n=1 Tax=Pedobacter nototheniae TaxID=2488994 RepID=UPI001039D85E|nr:outer membrane beta-barrel family protein [Pedobacter nototheniae]